MAAVAVGCVAVVAVGGTVIVAGCVVVATVCVTGGATGAGATVTSRAGTFNAFGYVPTSETLRSREAKAFATSARMMPAATIAAA